MSEMAKDHPLGSMNILTKCYSNLPIRLSNILCVKFSFCPEVSEREKLIENIGKDHPLGSMNTLTKCHSNLPIRLFNILCLKFTFAQRFI